MTGTSLVGIAAEANDTDDAVLGRKAYVDGLTYLLKSLPTDLNVHEAEQIRSALPGQVSQRWEEESRLERQQHQQQLGVDDYYGSGPGSPGGYRRQHKSTVHRVVQALVLNAILLVHLVLPYLALLLRAAVSVERRYHMSETLIGHGVSAVNVAGRQCARAAEVVLATASPGSDVSSTFAWAVEEITRGVSDGLGEGLLMTRLRDGGVS